MRDADFKLHVGDLPLCQEDEVRLRLLRFLIYRTHAAWKR